METVESFDIFSSVPNGIEYAIDPDIAPSGFNFNEPKQSVGYDENQPQEASNEVQPQELSFKTVDEARAYYESLMNSEDWKSQQDLKVQEYIALKQQEVEDFAVAFKAMQADPLMFFARYIPDALSHYGISPVLSEDQIASQIDQRIKEEFGENYKDRWNVNEMIAPGSFSQKVYYRQNEILNELTALNEQNKQSHQAWLNNVASAQAPQQRSYDQEAIEAAYDANFQAIYPDKQQYERFVDAVKDHQPTLQELHQIAFFNDYVKLAYNNGIEAGKKQTLQGVRKEGNPVMSPVQRSVEPSDSSFMGSLSVFGNGGLPMY